MLRAGRVHNIRAQYRIRLSVVDLKQALTKIRLFKQDVAVCRDDQIRIRTVKSADGKVWWAAFTSFDEELKGSSSVKSTFLVSLEQLIHMASETKEISGVIFNPWNRTIMLDHTLLSIIIGEENAGH